jgi:phenylalanyl-tRNA synthetase beta chain
MHCSCEPSLIALRIEPVEVVGADGHSKQTPDLSVREMDVDMSSVKKTIGIPDVENAELVRLLAKMGLHGTLHADGHKATVRVPPVRSDVLHAVDILEDVAIAYGFNRIPRQFPECATLGATQPLNALTEALRYELASCGYTVILNFGLVGTWVFFLLFTRVLILFQRSPRKTTTPTCVGQRTSVRSC